MRNLLRGLWVWLVYERIVRERRRRRERRQTPWTCRGCPGVALRAVGSDVGTKIAKCPRCGHMDRRLPDGRREVAWTPIPDLQGSIAWGRLGALLFALLGGALGVVTW